MGSGHSTFDILDGVGEVPPMAMEAAERIGEQGWSDDGGTRWRGDAPVPPGFSTKPVVDCRDPIAFSSTPAVTNTYHRRGRLSATFCSGMATTRCYDEQGRWMGEKYTGGTLGGLVVTNVLDGYARRQSVALKTTLGTTLATTTYATTRR